MSGKKTRFATVRDLWRAIFRSQGPMSQDIGQSGELLTARLRMGLIIVLAINPVLNTFADTSLIANWVGLAITAVAIALTYYVTRLAARERPPQSLPWFTSQFDIFVVSIAAIGFIASGSPIMATNNFIHWTYYLLGIAATCLRHNTRLTVFAVLSATTQYAAIALYVYFTYPGIHSTAYGYFQWENQIGKLVVMVLMGFLALSIVTRNRQVWERSVRDKLTNLHNRRFFDEFLEFKCQEYERNKRAFCLAMIDIDFFKKINDTKGHDGGDRVLADMGQYIGRSFRSSDVAARWGGEEFAVILSDCDIVEARERLETFRREIGIQIAALPITASIGVASFPADGASAELLMSAADARLYTAKRNGRNQTVAAA